MQENGSVPHLFPHALEITQRNFTGKDTAADCTLRTLSRIDRAFINVPLAEARDFHCHARVTDDLGERSIKSEHVAIRVVIQRPLACCGTVKRIPSWMSKRPVFCTNLKQISDDHQCSDEPFAALTDFKLIIEKAGKRTRHELLCNSQGSPSAKLSIAATAMRAKKEQTFGHIDALRRMGASVSTNAPLDVSSFMG